VELLVKGDKMLNCIVCKDKVEQIDWSTAPIHPYNALHFVTHGHYGSAIFDPMSEPEQLDIVICDLCIMKNLNIIHGSGVEGLQQNAEIYTKAAIAGKENK
jgi:hypothetical protein